MVVAGQDSGRRRASEFPKLEGRSDREADSFEPLTPPHFHQKLSRPQACAWSCEPYSVPHIRAAYTIWDRSLSYLR